MPFLSEVEFFRPGFVRGAVVDPSHPWRRWVVGLSLNGRLATTTLAEGNSTAWCQRPGFPPDCGFEFNLNSAALRDSDLITLTVVNSDHILAETAGADVPNWLDSTARDRAGYVRHVHGLTLSGVLDNGVTEFPAYEVLAFDGDRVVGRTRVFRWQHIGDPRLPDARAVGFDLLIDAALADGVPRKLRVETATGMPLNGSPIDFIAYPNSFRDACRALAPQKINRNADMILDRLLENSMPMVAYGDLYPELSKVKPVVSDDGVAAKEWVSRSLTGTGWVLIHHKSVRPRKDLAWLFKGISEAKVAYFDLAVQRNDQLFPLLLPAFDLERTLEQGYPALCFALPRSSFTGLRGIKSIFTLFLRAVADANRDEIVHVPHPGGILDESLLTDAGKDLAQAVQDTPKLYPVGTVVEPKLGATFPALRLRRPVQDRAVSVIIPSRNEGLMLKTCIDSLIAQNPGFDLDILVVDNRTTDPATLDVFLELERQGVRVLEFDDGFNFSVMNNLAAEHARHEQICFLNNDVEFPVPNVLEEMCSRLSDPTVGAVGPLMARASDIIQHGGVVLGPHNGACHAFEDRMRHDPGYGELLMVAREVSAVTGAMLLTRKSLFLSMGGFEEHLFAVNFNDVDYCLRLWSRGMRVIFTPHVWVRHFESVSRGRETLSPAGQRMMREVANLRLRWRDAILNDPFFHPLFSIDTLPYRALSTQHRAPEPRRSVIAPSSELPQWI